MALFSAATVWGGTTVLFQPGSPDVGPFPTDALTVADSAQKTGVRVNLTLPNPCGSPALSACTNGVLLNQLDGFSVNPRITLCFSDSIDASTLNSAVFFMAADGSGAPIKINQTIYDPIAKCGYAKPDRVLAQQTRYLMIVSGTLRGADGLPVQPAPAFTGCLSDTSPYCSALSAALRKVGQPVGGGQLVAASLFTTMSATDWLEKARLFVDAGPAITRSAGAVSTFNLNTVTSITYRPDDNSNQNTSIDIPKSALTGVEKVAFGLYLSPNFLNVSGPLAGSITVTPTNQPINPPVPVPGTDPSFPAGYVPVSYHVFLPPASHKPAGGFPVVIYGHGMGDNQFGAPTYIASTLAQQGFATLAIELPGHGFGANSNVTVVDQNGANVVATPGRAVTLSVGAPHGPTDGCIVGGALAIRDCGRQTAVDLAALVHTLQVTSGLGLNLDPGQIFFVGQSFGSVFGTLFHAVEPAVSRAVLNVGGGSVLDIARLAPTARMLGFLYLGTNNPGLLNVIPAIGALPQPIYHDLFNDNFPLRDRPVVVNDVPGAMPIQAAFEVADWLGMLGDPLAYAPHLKTAPLPGVPAKQTLFQFGFGDIEMPNPTESALARAADGISTTWFFRFDRATQTHPELLGITFPGDPLPILPHRYLSNPTIFSVPAEQSVSLATQMQVAKFFAGQPNPDPNPFLSAPFAGVTLFEVPAVLPESLNFLQLGASGGGTPATPPVTVQAVNISSVANGASFAATIEDGSWTSILGTNLASTTRPWNASTEIVNGNLPLSLDGVSVTIDGKPAPIYFISPTQLNVLTPITGKTGSVTVVVTNSAGTATFTANVVRAMPGLFLFDPMNRKYPAAVIGRSDGGVDYLGPAGLFGTALVTRPAKPGEILELYGTGFGPTNPAVAVGKVFSGAAPLDPSGVTATIGGVNAQVLYAGMTGAGLYQVNVLVPNVPDGDAKLVLSIPGAQTQDGVFVPVLK